ncbi:MAG: hypothetical protein ABIR62_10705 [Dokdonella sp.]|uniref:hypothetical protein n=1 Tax=Dokdonella sp. TaxID=2291710 RepID=UPI00326366C7
MKRFRYSTPMALAITALAGTGSMSARAAPADGVLDTSFGTNGRTIVGFDTLPQAPIDIALATVVDAFGRIYIVGVVNTPAGQRIGITRLKKNGALDTNYGSQDVGLVVAPEELGFTLSGASAAIDASGRLLVGGTVTVAGNDDFAVCRFNIDGTLDAFPNGYTCVSVAFDIGDSAHDDVLRSIAVQADGKIVMAGSATVGNGYNNAAFARLDTSGDLDSTFNGTGKLTIQGNFGHKDFKIHKVRIATNGKIVGVGEGRKSQQIFSEPLAVRVLANGAIDPTFGLASVAQFLGTPDRDARMRDFALLPANGPQDDQRMIAVGEVETAAGSGIYDGLLGKKIAIGPDDYGFGTAGSVIDTTGASLTFNAMQREANGNLTIVGTIRANANPATTLDDYITRYLPDGTRDTANFNDGSGFNVVDFLQPGGNDVGNAVAFQNDRIIIVGASLVSVGPPANFDFSAVAFVRDRIFASGVD